MSEKVKVSKEDFTNFSMEIENAMKKTAVALYNEARANGMTVNAAGGVLIYGQLDFALKSALLGSVWNDPKELLRLIGEMLDFLEEDEDVIESRKEDANVH